MEFRILGPLEAFERGVSIELGGSRQRALLAVLLLHRREAVSTDRLVDELWGESPPATATKTVHVYVSRLRKLLGEGVLETRGRGYVVNVEAGGLDAERFEALAREGRQALGGGDARAAAERLRAALDLWRGPALGEFAYESFAQAEALRLEESRLAATEDRIEAELALGHHAALVGELEQLADQNPLREPLQAQLMLALYRSGRQAEALEHFRQARSRLDEELGLEPGRALTELERAILNQEPALDPPAGSQRAAAREVRARRGRLLLAGGGVVVLAAAAAALVIALSGSSNRLLATTSGIGLIDARGGRLEALSGATERIGAVAADGSGAWATDTADELLLQLDPHARVVARIPVGGRPEGVVVGSGSVWVVNQADRDVWQINPRSVRHLRTFAVGNGAEAMALGFGSLWVANTLDDSLSRIDIASGRVRTISLKGSPGGVAVGPDGVWVASRSTGQLLLVDPSSDAVTQAVQISSEPLGVTAAAGYVWVASANEGTLARYDPRSGGVRKVAVEGAPSAAAVSGGSVWVAGGPSGTLARVDPRTLAASEVSVGAAPTALAASGTKLWVTLGPTYASHRGGTLRVAVGSPYQAASASSVDPAAFSGPSQWQALSMTSDGLVGYRRTGGLAGAALVPDLASTLPTPEDGGRTYTFRLRDGIEYSDGTLLQPSDFRLEFERIFRLGNSYAEIFYTHIVGAHDCVLHPSRCDLSRGIVTDDRRHTVTFHLVTPDPDFLYELTFPWASAVPARTPMHDLGRTPVPGTGPYMTQAVTPTRRMVGEVPLSFHSWTLVRNPRFHEWSSDAQPQGYPDRIVITNDLDGSAAASAVAHGQLDAVVGIPIERAGGLLANPAVAVHDEPGGGVYELTMNTRQRPFDHMQARRALNYAIDRGKVARLVGGPFAARPTCQILPPEIVGYAPYCPYTLSPDPSGTWHAPDMARANRLVRASGTAGARVRLAIEPESNGHSTAGLRSYLVALLRKLGYRVAVPGNPSAYEQAADSRSGFQLTFAKWYEDYAAPSDFVTRLLSCAAFTPADPENLNLAQYCSPPADAASRLAQSLETTEPAGARRDWARVDRMLTDAAPWVPLYNARVPVVVNARVGNYEFHPFWTVLYDQLWVR